MVYYGRWWPTELYGKEKMTSQEKNEKNVILVCSGSSHLDISERIFQEGELKKYATCPDKMSRITRWAQYTLAVLVLPQELDLIETKGSNTLACEKVFSIPGGRSPGESPSADRQRCLVFLVRSSVTLEKHFPAWQFQVLISNTWTMERVDLV